MLSLVSRDDIVAIDFSDFGSGKQVLMFAKQAKRGRALPLYFEILEYPIERGSQNLFVIATIERFFQIVGCTPTLVFDRGFACPSIIKFLAQNQYRFVIRIKKRKHVSTLGSAVTVAVEEIEEGDARVEAYGTDLRLIRSDDPRNGNDPWYLITNDADSTREEIIDRYYHRFEIEEFFRDAKHILGFERLCFRTTRGLTIALWFAILTAWLFERVAHTLTDVQNHERSSWRVSIFRYVFEKLRQEYVHAAAPPLCVCAAAV